MREQRQYTCPSGVVRRRMAPLEIPDDKEVRATLGVASWRITVASDRWIVVSVGGRSCVALPEESR